MAWLHAVQFPWSGLRCGIPFATGSQGFPETRLDVTMQGLFYQTSTPIFQSSCFFNNFRLRRAATIVGPPLGTNCLAQWHGDVHERNMRVDHWSFGIARSGGPRSRGRTYAGAALQDACRTKERTIPKFLGNRRCCLVVLGIEAGDRWNKEASNFIRMPAQARARSSPPSLRAATTSVLVLSLAMQQPVPRCQFFV